MKLTQRQEAAVKLLAGGAQHVMLFGGSRSGKTFLLTLATCVRAIKAPGSRHAILRFRFNAVKASVILDTFPKVMAAAFPQIEVRIDKQDWIAHFPNGSQVWFGGLDDKERTEKILGQEFATIFLNECSQIPKSSRDMAVTRLAQVAMTQIEGAKSERLPLKIYHDCNPPSKGHWTYKLFVRKADPETGLPLPDPEAYAAMQMNPEDNSENLPESYLETLRGLPARLQKRFLLGEFADENPHGLFQDEVIDKWRHLGGELPDMVRVIVAVDPSGSGDADNADNDAIGIVVAGLGTDGNAYVLEDCTVKAGPSTWGAIATSAFERHQADLIVGEQNFGGAMVQQVIQSSRPRTPYKGVTASRGKAVRAEPFSVLYEQGKVRHVGYFRELEDELAGMSTMGFTGQGSPNRADALVWALAELFPALTTVRKQSQRVQPMPFSGHAQSWMAA